VRAFALAVTLSVLFYFANALAGDALVVGAAVEGLPTTTNLEKIATEMGFRPTVVVFFLQWPDDPSAKNFPRKALTATNAFGATPVVTWEPMTLGRGGDQAVPGQAILDGIYDGYIQDFAVKARAFGKPMILRFAHEMNLARYHWGTTEKEYGPRSPELYKKLFRHVADIFRRAGAYNVRFAFCPNAESRPNEPWNSLSAYYPGDDYVDVLGLDGYNFGTTRNAGEHGWTSVFRSFPEIFGAAFREMRALSPDKPFFVFETACALEGGDKSAWVKDMIGTLVSWRVVGFAWFEADKEADWRLGKGLTPDALGYLRSVSALDAGTLFR
jgi:mannan endo-1,4-beta-mannosidase